MDSKQIFISFWIFGLINNVLYVVILSAAIDLVGPFVPKATVLLADVLPSFTMKLSAPFFIHFIPYNTRIVMLIFLSVIGMLLVTFGAIGWKIFGIILASISSGLGELTFLQLTHFFEETSLQGWSSGTGGAGLIGSGVFLLLTTVLKIDVKLSLLMFTLCPLGFLYYFRLPRTSPYSPLQSIELTTQPSELKTHITHTLERLKPLCVPFMGPLFTVYLAEYLINQSIAPTLLFPIESTPFHKYRDMYVTYGTLYQLGVFISRSSASFVRIRKLYVPSILQWVNVVVLLLQSILYFIPNIYIIMMIVFYEGLLGGASYVNTFMLVLETISDDEREFSLGATSLSDSGGIVVAALLGMWIEPSLCHYQVDHGREWCHLN
ncbi:unnamed protein product [Cyberlindnera jadinii]|uniref:Protein BTN n=1 Tax=Cyberlindnera jadinii (strain ATCC 18201 / CBS 1600 / BCRC 20928 / JCM 3617 / NBRC 0987 / NRRL Y-1542) TaxID=983966 RepID=A0A0H5C0H9_CYBJN|nr:batten's disease protein Cln3 [Cyberlindnera jadinii NRRL Y-1542]ODV70883.1 batten's disease protein Cln3 [Cyberlindnera jadinii NRRL Y-1542]CEP21228.1 unnamed protein product [Cyberlindnera jadinii]